MRYVSTRGQCAPLRFQDAVLTGLAADGGLLVPETIPSVRSKLAAWRELSYADLACEVFAEFIDDIPRAELRQLVNASYGKFDCADVVALRRLRQEAVLELFHGPTLAFKDVALQFLGNLFEYILGARHETLNVIGATSGDTGSAAIEGVRGRNGIRIFIMYPLGRTSRLQELQMTTVADANVHTLAIEGSFDDCQAILKSIFNDLPFKQRYSLGAVNSVNWARVLAQIVYYFYAAFRTTRSLEEPVSFSVPTGNFGDVFAGFVASRMGLPVRRLLLATNENDILSVFFNTGVYRRGPVYQTISPSMDIQVASNFERYLYYLMAGDCARLQRFMEAFSTRGEARFDGATDSGVFAATSVGTEETRATIRSVYAEEGYVLDPHSAVGVAAARRLRLGSPVVCLATAHPAKFPEALADVVPASAIQHVRLQALLGKPERRVVLPARVDAVQTHMRRVIDG